jgi:hypothetical protein
MSNLLRPEPQVRLGDWACSRPVRWERIDDVASRLVAAEVVAVPSVRVALCWILEYLQLRRHVHHVLVPRFVGRCILNALNRVALPVEVLTNRTRAVIPVHQYGFRQDLEAVRELCLARGIPYVEDSPFGLEPMEAPGEGSLAKVIGLSKSLPLLKGAVALSGDAELRRFLRIKREYASPWSWPLFAILASVRCGRFGSSHSTWAEIAYELYPKSGGDNGAFRANFLAALRRSDQFERTIGARIERLQRDLGERLRVPSTTRLGTFALLRAGEDPQPAGEVLRRLRFDSALYHFDAHRNLLDPEFEKVFLIPLNPRVPEETFGALVTGLTSIL